MIKEYLKSLKQSGNLSWQDISKASGLPEATIRKIFSGETADPRFETVVRLVSAMGGSLGKINDIDKKENIDKDEDSHINSLIAVKEVYEERIKDILAANAEQTAALKRDKKILIAIAVTLGAILIAVLIVDLLFGNHGWITY